MEFTMTPTEATTSITTVTGIGRQMLKLAYVYLAFDLFMSYAIAVCPIDGTIYNYSGGAISKV